jgi:hypothetical protein
MEPKHKERNDTAPVPPGTPRRPYFSPRLLVYGAVRELTAGGTGHAVETSQSQRYRT